MAEIETGRFVAYPWLCDQMGHLNVANYVSMFDQASFHFLAELGYQHHETPKTRLGWADVRHTIDYKAEVPMGGLVVIASGITKVGRTSLTFASTMRQVGSGLEHARFEVITVHFDLEARKAIPLPPDLAAKAQALLDGD